MSDAVLLNAVARAGKGQVDADLGGGVIKQRVARAGHGKSGGYRTQALRRREHVSQTVLANYLNVTPNLVSKWERGEKRPSGYALKLLLLVDKHGLAAVA